MDSLISQNWKWALLLIQPLRLVKVGEFLKEASVICVLDGGQAGGAVSTTSTNIPIGSTNIPIGLEVNKS